MDECGVNFPSPYTYSIGEKFTPPRPQRNYSTFLKQYFTPIFTPMERYLAERIKDVANSDLVEVISPYVPLKKQGAGFVGKCPFHDDHKPSLSVSPAKGLWKCFACGESGDAIAFVEKYENIGYVQALEVLAAKFSIYTGNSAPNAAIVPSRPRVPIKQVPITTQVPIKAAEPLAEIPAQFVVNSHKYTFENSLFNSLFPYFATGELAAAFDNYMIGGTKDGKCVFWCFDTEGVCRYGKAVMYKPDGHRDHNAGSIYAVHTQVAKRMRDAGLWTQDYEPHFAPALFGAHLLRERPTAVVGVVEAEKSAIIASLVVPDILWVATGGEHNLNANTLASCKGRSMLLFSDYDAREVWGKTAQELNAQGFNVTLVQWWDGLSDLGEKYDIADVILHGRKPMRKMTQEEFKKSLSTPTLTPTPTPCVEVAVLSTLEKMQAKNPALSTLIKKLNLVEV